ncbi:MAG: carbon storage regulator CsrA [Synergistaceae bacterium]|jgi:carbon storage regulator|nr:carbon storage regulator CsrA [Synergistaceae bacterium]
MLVLSRRLNESIQIGEDIQVTVVDVRGDVVRLGISAPQKTQIWRKELWDAIVEENRKAALAAAESSKRTVTAPQLPVSTFSKLSKLKTVRPKKTTKVDKEKTEKADKTDKTDDEE